MFITLVRSVFLQKPYRWQNLHFTLISILKNRETAILYRVRGGNHGAVPFLVRKLWTRELWTGQYRFSRRLMDMAMPVFFRNYGYSNAIFMLKLSVA